MALQNKRDVPRPSKGKEPRAPAKPPPRSSSSKAKPPPVQQPPSNDGGDVYDSEDEDENNGGVSEKGMKRLMELVNEEDLDDLERAQLGVGSDDEDEEEDEEEDEGEGDETGVSDGDEEDTESLEMEGDGPDEEEELSEDDQEDGIDEIEGDEEDDEMEGNERPPVKKGKSILIAEPEADALALDDIGSDVSLDEDAVPARKVTMNNKPGMRTVTEGFKVTHMPWPEHLVLSSTEVIEADPGDDLQREMAFYKLALEFIPRARKLAAKHDIPFTRPSDYYAEMVKSDEHMERVRTKLVDEAQGIKKSEVARKQRHLKKFGKQIQVEKLKSRDMDKKSFNEKMQGIKRKRKDGMDLGNEDGDDFGIEVDDALEGRPVRGGPAGRGRGGRDKPKGGAREGRVLRVEAAEADEGMMEGEAGEGPEGVEDPDEPVEEDAEEDVEVDPAEEAIGLGNLAAKRDEAE